MRLTSFPCAGKGPRRGQRPLARVRALEFTGLAPAPFACVVLADLGADVIRGGRAYRASGEHADVLVRDHDRDQPAGGNTREASSARPAS